MQIFGVAITQSKQVLQSIIRQLVAGNALRVNLEKFGALEITRRGARILQGNEKFMAKTTVKTIPPASKENNVASSWKVQTNPEVFAELKKVRLELARERSVPAFVVFSDKTLLQMARDMPTTKHQFLAINGVGRTKLEEFYHQFQEVITKFKGKKI